MKSNSDSATRKPKSAAPGNPAGQPAGNGYAPSVPITVYRELAAELQATKAMMESMTVQNQQLVRQNQLLKQEIERLVQSALTLQHIAGIAQPAATVSTPSAPTHPEAMQSTSPHGAIADLVRQATRPAQPRVERPAPTPEPVTPVMPVIEPTPAEPDDSLSNDLFAEIVEEPHRHEKRPPTSKDMGGFWLTATIAVIVVTAFGAGFMVVRPLLPGR
ncbi:hypothetical protein H6G89_25275 [Oscillatoria sp. FACHB-1407]|uniref:hypothetical protein n=1 Tax=Oscillatoria sp. FACHB-1407 TaxID=2692847 RepID=UPI0016826CAE|nr:hypothetical protein [Oscillatoria sp. FACHB-1407]MBD2464320.1 hypothetical protein [Oscillatoria sp. FACHB-1407]